MRFSCLLLVSLLSSLSAVPQSAQPADQPQTIPKTPALPATLPSMVVQFSDGFQHPVTPLRLPDPKMMQELRRNSARETASPLMANDERRCYSIESYRFQRESPDLDAMRMTGHSDCAPANEFHLKPVLHAKH